MKIVTIGTFDAGGCPIGWCFDLGTIPVTVAPRAYCLGIDLDGDNAVTVNGVEIVEWSEARRAAMKHGMAGEVVP